MDTCVSQEVIKYYNTCVNCDFACLQNNFLNEENKSKLTHGRSAKTVFVQDNYYQVPRRNNISQFKLLSKIKHYQCSTCLENKACAAFSPLPPSSIPLKLGLRPRPFSSATRRRRYDNLSYKVKQLCCSVVIFCLSFWFNANFQT